MSTNQTFSIQPATGPPGTVRLSASGQWFPEFIYEVLAHRTGRLISVTMITTGPAQPRAWIEHFPCEDIDSCAISIRDWLVARALETSGLDDRILDWAFRLSERITMPGAPA